MSAHSAPQIQDRIEKGFQNQLQIINTILICNDLIILSVFIRVICGESPLNIRFVVFRRISLHFGSF